MAEPLPFKGRNRAQRYGLELEECAGCEVTFDLDELTMTEDGWLCGECLDACDPEQDDDADTSL